VDARRLEVYTCAYDFSLSPMMEKQPLILDETSYADILAEGRRTLFFGDGSAKAMEVIKSVNAEYIPDIVPLAIDMIALSEQAYSRREFLDTAYCTPYYIKDFQATKPKNKLDGQNA
ncbi:MAG: tRNA (adenosine(37)-N6)-threonylcarbamoyltransferase complex dimerization subunit type 1 TsaB, partial [Duncaniella sp.]|nr:tRNA (adenosine(37)-N6)-threonylcarbamoyltransferase complex dimerization subunit type 1 TsaB [Duncaniella sp.]